MEKCKFCGSDPIIRMTSIGNWIYKAVAVCSNNKCCARTSEFFSSDADWRAKTAWNRGEYDIHRDDEGFIQRL